MALTQTAWVESSANSKYVATCSVTATIAENDAYTLKTPSGLDTSKPFVVSLTCAATPDGQALPIDIWLLWDDDANLTGDGANVTTSPANKGGKFKQIFDNAVLAVSPLVYSFLIDPELPVADVVTVADIATGPKVRVPSAPYYAFNLNGGSPLAATTHYWTISQG